VYSIKWTKSTVKGREARTMLDIMWHINQQIKYLNRGKVVIYNDNRKLLNKLNYGITKLIEYA